MTTPGGVSNLPVGALTLPTLAAMLQDMTPEAMRGRAVGRVSSIFDGSTGGDPSIDVTPFGILTTLFAGFNSNVANADPADIQGPEDLPDLLLDFIESLPVIGQFVGLIEAILGTYDGDDPELLAIQSIFALIRNLFAGVDFSDPGSVNPAQVWAAVASAFLLPLNLFATLVGGVIPGVQIPGLDASKIVSGTFSQARVENLVEDLSTAVWNASSALSNALQLTRSGGSNMVLAPDFEDDASWDHALGAPSTEQAHSGTKSRKITANGSWQQLVLTHDSDGDPIGVPTVPGRTYYIEVQIRAHAANVTPAGVDIYVTGVSIDNAGVDTWVDSNVIEAASLSSSTWVTKTVRVTMPAGAVNFRPVVWLPDDVAVGDAFYVDDAVVQDVTEAQSVMSTIIAALGGSGSQFAGLTQALQNIPGANIVGAIAASLITGVLGAAQIPGLDASKITSGIFGTGQIPGLDAAKIVSGAFGLAQIPGLPASQITSGTLLASLIPGLDASKIVSGAFSLAQLPGSVLTTGSSIPAANLTGTITEAVTGLNSLRDAFVNGLFGGATGTAYSNADAQQQAAIIAQQAAAAQAAAAAANAAIAAQQAQQNSNNNAGGFYKNIIPSGADGAALSAANFTATGPTSGDLCIRGSSGYVGIKFGAGHGIGFFATINGTYLTDDQSLEITLGDQGSWDQTGTYLLFHSDTANTAGVYCKVTNDQITVGTYTRSGSTYSFSAPWGSGGTINVSVSGGNRVGIRNVGTTYTISLNGNVLGTVVNASATFGATRRSAHVAMDRQHSGGFFGWGAGDYDGFRIAGISMSDYVQPTYLGSGARITRSSTATVTPVRTASSNLMPASFFNVIQESTADIRVDLASGKFTVANAGWYQIKARIQSGGLVTSTGGGSKADQYLLLYKNGTLFQFGQAMSSMFPSSGSDSIGYRAQFGTFQVYLNANDYVQLGYNNSAAMATAWTMTGSADNAQTYFEISLLNRSTM